MTHEQLNDKGLFLLFFNSLLLFFLVEDSRFLQLSDLFAETSAGF